MEDPRYTVTFHSKYGWWENCECGFYELDDAMKCREENLEKVKASNEYEAITIVDEETQEELSRTEFEVSFDE